METRGESLTSWRDLKVRGGKKHCSNKKRLKLNERIKEEDCNKSFDESNLRITSGITCLPVELLLEICSYLNSRDLYNLREVCKLFKRIVGNPIVWRSYEVIGNDLHNLQVIQELKRMPFLKKFVLNARADSDDILRQLSVTNKNLEELYVSNCTGATAKLYVKSLNLIRILQKCTRLHTVSILGTRFRGVKFYKLLADMGLRLKAASTPATCLQFRTFANNAMHIPEAGRQAINEMCFGNKNWAPLHYYVIERGDEATPSVFVSYLNADFISVDI